MSASSLYDDLRVFESENGPTGLPEFSASSKNVVDINDNNQGNYSGGQIVLDLNSLVSSEDFLDMGASYLTVPITMTATSSVATGGIIDNLANMFAMTFKGSNLAIINSINVTCSNKQLVGNTQMSQIVNHWKLVTQQNRNDVDAIGATLGFQKDTSRTIAWNSTIGETNNNLSTANPNGLYSAAGLQNTGMFNRCVKQAVATSDPNFNSYAYGSVVTTDRKSSVSWTTTTVSPVFPAVTFQLYLEIPMKDLHDLFKQMPLCRGALWQMVISTHLPCSFTATLASTAAGTQVQWGCGNGPSTSLYQFIPFMVAQPCTLNGTTAAIAQGAPVLPATTAQTFTFAASIGNTQATLTTFHAVQYKLNPTLASKYMANPRKRIVFMDYIRCAPAALTNVLAGATNSLVANLCPGISKVRGLLIVPYISATGSGLAGNGTVTGMSALQSPFSSCGATTAPWHFIDQFNVLIGGRAIWQKPLTYRYDAFLREQFGVNAPNGNGVEGLRVGLIDEDDYNSGYGYIYVNLERHLASSDDLPVSVDVQFQTNYVQSLSYNCFIFFEKEFSLDCSNGKILV
jgi:hypothetical protein